jgi:hypothetical protein
MQFSFLIFFFLILLDLVSALVYVLDLDSGLDLVSVSARLVFVPVLDSFLGSVLDLVSILVLVSDMDSCFIFRGWILLWVLFFFPPSYFIALLFCLCLIVVVFYHIN